MRYLIAQILLQTPMFILFIIYPMNWISITMYITGLSLATLLTMIMRARKILEKGS